MGMPARPGRAFADRNECSDDRSALADSIGGIRHSEAAIAVARGSMSAPGRVPPIADRPEPAIF
jgi:hypothetical protein